MGGERKTNRIYLNYIVTYTTTPLLLHRWINGFQSAIEQIPLSHLQRSLQYNIQWAMISCLCVFERASVILVIFFLVVLMFNFVWNEPYNFAVVFIRACTEKWLFSLVHTISDLRSPASNRYLSIRQYVKSKASAIVISHNTVGKLQIE